MQLPWLAPGDPFPDAAAAWGKSDPVPGLLAAGGALDVETLLRAYRRGIFPWFSDGQPILWWSPDPRMTLEPARFRLHRSLRKRLTQLLAEGRLEIRFDSQFETVIAACSAVPRAGQSGTWIVPEMVHAYGELHRAGHAHSVETWLDGELAGGLYCVGIGRAVFGESMFALRPDASKMALAALVAFCLQAGVEVIDCQQNTAHLASLGGAEVARRHFVQHVARARELAPPSWRFDPLYWRQILPERRPFTS